MPIRGGGVHTIALGQKKPLRMLQILAPERLVSEKSSHSPLEFSASFPDVRFSPKRSFRSWEFGKYEGQVSVKDGQWFSRFSEAISLAIGTKSLEWAYALVEE